MAKVYCTSKNCGVELTQREIDTGKGRCVAHIVNGYKWALGQMNGQIEELRQQLAYLMNQNPGKADVIRGMGEKKPKEAPVEVKSKVAPPVVKKVVVLGPPVVKKVTAPKRRAPIVKKVKKRK